MLYKNQSVKIKLGWYFITNLQLGWCKMNASQFTPLYNSNEYKRIFNERVLNVKLKKIL